MLSNEVNNINRKYFPTSRSRWTTGLRVSMRVSRKAEASSNSVFGYALGIRSALFKLASVNLGGRTSTTCFGIALTSRVTFTLMSSNQIDTSKNSGWHKIRYVKLISSQNPIRLFAITELPKVSICFRTQFPSLGIFINKKVGNRKN